MDFSIDRSQWEKSGTKRQDWRVSKMGYDFELYSNRWQLDGSRKVSWDWMEGLSAELQGGLRQAIGRMAEESSASHTSSTLSEARNYFRLTQEREFTVLGLASYKAMMGDDNEYRLARLRGLLIAWFDWGYDGVRKEVVDYLDEMTLKGNVKGKAVRSRCAITGPLTKIEQGALIEWSANAFSVGHLSLEEFALLMALMLTGRRMVQIRSLKACDLTAREDAGGNDYLLKVPRAKQRQAGFRSEFRVMSIEEDLYLLLDNLSRDVRRRVEEHLETTLPEKVAQQLPLFMEESRLERFCSAAEFIAQTEMQADYLHLSSSSSYNMVRSVSIKNRAISERTGDYIFLSSRRFRYTKGTNLANRGITGNALAYSLDHSDIQNVDFYVENTAASAEYIDEIMAPALAPLAQAFAGKLIASESDAIRANDPHSRIKNNHSGNVGNCGTHNFCASGYRACYTCINFQPWLDAPHHEVRDEVVAERKRQQDRGVSPAVIGSTDRLLLAVEEVIRLCGEMKKVETYHE